MEQISRDSDMDGSLRAFVISIPRISAILPETSPSGSITPTILSVLGSDTFELPFMDWNEATPSTTHEVLHEGIPGDIDEVDLRQRSCISLTDFIHEELDWHPELPPQ